MNQYIYIRTRTADTFVDAVGYPAWHKEAGREKWNMDATHVSAQTQGTSNSSTKGTLKRKKVFSTFSFYRSMQFIDSILPVCTVYQVDHIGTVVRYR